ncbi:MAG: DNA translocase FtsK, partial [Slackia sp.]|nr:DNA translocase FtsK [Slackia sp.]
MARGSKKNTAQSNSAKGASTQRKKGKNNAEERVALKDAPSRGRARARVVEEEAPFEEIDREPRIFDDRTKRDIAGVIVAVLAVVLFLAVVLQPSGFLTSALSSALHLSLGIGAYVLPFILVIVGA